MTWRSVQLNDKQELFNRQITPRRRSADDLVVQMHDDMEICAITWMELDIERETNEEEQINIKRLNSLLRFLALGDTPECEEMSGEDEPCNAKRDRGQCTWSTRGTSEGGNGEAAEAEKTFCACEWGYYGENCEKVKCPGFGMVRLLRLKRPSVLVSGVIMERTVRRSSALDLVRCCTRTPILVCAATAVAPVTTLNVTTMVVIPTKVCVQSATSSTMDMVPRSTSVSLSSAQWG